MSVILETRDLNRSFGAVSAARDINVIVSKGETVGIIGANGAGKTTFVNIVTGYVKPSSGTVHFDGHDITGVPAHRLAAIGIGRTFQNLAVFKHASVVDNLLVGRHCHMATNVLDASWFFGRARREEMEHRRKVEEIIDFLEIEEVRNMPVGTLSYGLQKRVELGRALATQPKLLLLDEMVSGMNSEETEDIARFVLDIRDELGISVLMVEHDMGIVMDISDRICVLNFGRKIGEGTPAEISANPAVIDAYLGSKTKEAA